MCNYPKRQVLVKSYDCLSLASMNLKSRTGRNLPKKCHGNVHFIILCFATEQKIESRVIKIFDY